MSKEKKQHKKNGKSNKPNPLKNQNQSQKTTPAHQQQIQQQQ